MLFSRQEALQNVLIIPKDYDHSDRSIPSFVQDYYEHPANRVFVQAFTCACAENDKIWAKVLSGAVAKRIPVSFEALYTIYRNEGAAYLEAFLDKFMPVEPSPDITEMHRDIAIAHVRSINGSDANWTSSEHSRHVRDAVNEMNDVSISHDVIKDARKIRPGSVIVSRSGSSDISDGRTNVHWDGVVKCQKMIDRAAKNGLPEEQGIVFLQLIYASTRGGSQKDKFRANYSQATRQHEGGRFLIVVDGMFSYLEYEAIRKHVISNKYPNVEVVTTHVLRTRPLIDIFEM